MTTRTVTAMFNSRGAAERAAQQLQSEFSLASSAVRISPDAGVTDAGYDPARPNQETGFFGSLKSLLLPDEDRFAYAEGVRRGNVLVSAQVDEGHIARAAEVLESAGALDLDQQEMSWRQSGWTGYSAGSTAAAVAVKTGATERSSVQAGGEVAIPIVEESLVVAKREVDRGRVRVRSYVTERAAEAQVTLHEERVEVERRPVDRAFTDAERTGAFTDRVIEATASAEEAVVGKQSRVVEEVVVGKQATDRVETVRDTVRRTEVEVEGSDSDVAGAATGAVTTDNSLGAKSKPVRNS